LERLAPRPILLGRHLITLGLKPGPAMKGILDAAFEAQLDGAFGDENGALAWARLRLGSPTT
jgi:tRNA nucleotidyltransferase (CCA-adding enzyme)